MPLNLHLLRADGGCNGDDFNDGNYDPSRWGEVITDPASPSSLAEGDGHVLFTGSSFAISPWSCSSGSYLVDWEVAADVSLGEVVLSQDRSHVEVALAAFNPEDPNLNFGVPGDNFSISLDVYRDSQGQVERSFETYLRTNWVDIPFDGEAIASSQEAGLRLTFSAGNKTLTAWYDPDGNGEGYGWTALRSAQIDHPDSDWELADDSVIQVGVMASCDGFTVDSSHEVWVDKVVVSGAFVPARPTTPFLTIGRSNGLPVLALSGDVGRQYWIEYVPEISGGTSWQSLTSIILTNSVQTHLDVGIGNGRLRFYRAVAGP